MVLNEALYGEANSGLVYRVVVKIIEIIYVRCFKHSMVLYAIIASQC